MNSPDRHFTRYMDHDWGDGSRGRDDRVLYTCDEEPNGPLYDEHFRPIGGVSPQSVATDEGAAGGADALPVTLSCRRGDGLGFSWAILSRGDVVIAEEPISHDLCDALLMQERLLTSALDQCGGVMLALGWSFMPESGLGLVYNNLLMILRRQPFQPKEEECDDD